ncbi:DUF1003 domain-containing protein [Bacillus sp. RG28]|uniref:DUF1003 domain-containing protein n=1 Tax=Gottfriedia endophytica TaxID=2820819 RepID=A0A940SJQ5_9BACI|nr:DUF1003 domain-containing protein [Gottfriedia endophytica]MBP0726275.1 DUF1003 domain-containing protein [Gottfriedia endophytica]
MVQRIWKQMNLKAQKQEPAKIQGFDIDLNQENLSRIDRLVDRYESEILHQLDSDYTQRTKWADRLADKIAQFGGSWRFITWFACFLAGWIIWNSLSITKAWHFDAPPYILLNLCLSFIAAFQAPVIMMSQNRQATRDKHESVIDFAINYKAEQEIDDMQSRLHHIESQLTEIKELLKQHKSE